MDFCRRNQTDIQSLRKNKYTMDPSAPRPLEEGVEGEAGGAVDAAVEEDAEDEKRVAIEICTSM